MTDIVRKKELAEWLKENPDATAKEIQKQFLERDKPTAGLFGMWAKHEEHGDVIITTDNTLEDGIVWGMWKDSRAERGSYGHPLLLSDLEFPHLYTRPEDVEVGGVWMVDCRAGGGKIERCKAFKEDENYWCILDEHDSIASDDAITLIYPFTPERPQNTHHDS